MKTTSFMPPHILERVAEYNEKREAMRKIQIELHRKERAIQLEMDEIALNMLVEAGLPEDAVVGELYFNLEDGWECPDNVIGVCVYDYKYEECIYCGEPDERK
jgi:hypothetical protein